MRKALIAGLLLAPAIVSAATFTRPLSLGMSGSDVTSLQNILIAQNLLPAGDATGYYGTLTQAAVEKYQSAKGIVSSGTPSTTGYGAVGPKTLASLNGTTNPNQALIDQLLAEVKALEAQIAAILAGQHTSTGGGSVVAGSPSTITNYTPSGGGGGGGGSSSSSSGSSSSGGSSSSSGGSSGGSSSSSDSSGGSSSTSTPDTTPPSITITAPTANLAANTTQTTLAATTNEAATCRYSTNASFTFSSGTLFTTTGTTNHSTTLSPLANGTAYTYYVKCQDTSGNTSGNASVTFSVATPADTQAPTTPTGLTATAISSSQINLTWTASTDNVGVTGYTIYRGGTQIGTSATNSYSDTGLSASTQYSYTVSASDAAGNTSSQSTGVSTTTQSGGTSGTCPKGTSYADGCSGASAGTPQFPTILSSYADRSPWNVAGVDYAVGIPSGTVLKDPTTVALPSGCSLSGTTVTCNGTVTLTSYDFSLHNGTTLKVTGGNVTVQDSKFVVGTNQGSLGDIINVSGTTNFTFLNNEVDGANIPVTAQQGQTINITSTGSVTFKYNYLHNSGGDMIDLGGGPQVETFQYNLWKDIGLKTAHSDTIQWCGSKVSPGSDIGFNVVDQTAAGLSGEGLLTINSECSGASMSGIVVHNNTLISKAQDNFVTGADIQLDAGSATADHIAVIDNYTDPTGVMNFTASPWFPTGYGGLNLPHPSAMHDLINMTTGISIPVPSVTNKTQYSPFYYTYPDLSGYTPSLNDIYSITASPSSGTIASGQSIIFTVSMDEPWIVTGTPTLSLSSGGVATYTGGSGTNLLTFMYTVGSGQSATNLAVTALNLNGGTIKDAFGNSTNVSGVAATFTGLSVGSGSSDTTAPSVPAGLSTTVVSSSQINLSWTASTDNVGVTGYNIYRNGTKIGTSATNSYGDTGLNASTNYSYTVSAYDAAGNTSTQSSSVSATTQAVVSGGSCPKGSAYADGCSSAPTGTPEFPTILSSYFTRPPWNVAGVDYYVGYPAGTVLKDPSGGALPSCATVNVASSRVTVTGNNCTLNGFDFSLDNGYGILINGGVSGTVIENSKFTVGSSGQSPISALGGSSNLTVLNNTINAGGSSDLAPSLGDFIFYEGTGNLVVEYNYIYNTYGHMLDFVGGNPPVAVTPTVEYNVFYGWGMGTGSHGNPWYMDGNNAIANGHFDFNTILQPANPPVKGGNPALALPAGETGVSITNTTLNNNVALEFAGANGISYVFGGASASDSVQNNYFDPTGAFGDWYSSVAAGTTIANNINMKTGVASFPPGYSGSSDTTPPSTPTNLSATAVSSSQINLTWTAATDNVGVTGYNIYRGGTKIGTSATNSYSDTGLSASTQYSYTVSASDAAGNTSAQSSSASATTQAGADTTPPVITISAPSGQLAANTTSTTLSVTTNEAATCAWSNTAGSAFASMTTFSTTGGTTHSTTLTGLSNGSSYTTYVKCKDTAGNISTDSSTAYSVASGGGGGSPITIVLTSGTSWTVPANWNNANNTIELIGAGAGGASGGSANGGVIGAGGGGGKYGKKTNVTLAPGTAVVIQVGRGGSAGVGNDVNGTAGGDTIFNSAATTVAGCSGSAICVQGGQAPTGTTFTVGGAGGSTSFGINSGANGGAGGAGGTISGMPGGGGSGGPLGAGAKGGDGDVAGGSTQAGSGGGGADNGSAGIQAPDGGTAGAGGTNGSGVGGGGTGGSSHSNGGAGTNENTWGVGIGPGGGGGGGGNASPGGNGGPGAIGGGGGGGSWRATSGGAGGNGIIVITYTP